MCIEKFEFVIVFICVVEILENEWRALKNENREENISFIIT
jgi:hypothetical protein